MGYIKDRRLSPNITKKLRETHQDFSKPHQINGKYHLTLRDNLSFTPRFEITDRTGVKHMGRDIGHFTRGHGMIPDHLVEKLFLPSLMHVEEYERRIFKGGLFEEYKKHQIDKFESIIGKEEKAEIGGLKNPAHIEVIASPEVARKMIEAGYVLSRTTYNRIMPEARRMTRGKTPSIKQSRKALKKLLQIPKKPTKKGKPIKRLIEGIKRSLGPDRETPELVLLKPVSPK
ncbi:MAG: hypothetical protein ABIA76_00890 [Candidatus Diapherotrites archaeon]